MSDKKDLAQDLPQTTHEKFLHSIAHNKSIQLTDENHEITWWSADSAHEFFTFGPCIGPLCVATRKTDNQLGSLFYDSEKLAYYDFVPAEPDSTNYQVNDDDGRA